MLTPVLQAALAAWLAAAQSAPQQPPSISHSVIVTATTAPIAAESTSRTVTVLTREDLARLGITWLADAIRLAPGVDVRARGPFDVQTDISIRGATFGQSLVLLDGTRLNNSQSGHHNGEMPAPMAAIDRIEIAAGPASSAHGSDALGGVINVITRSDAHAEMSAAAGQHGYAAVQATVSGLGVPRLWSVAGWGSRSRGFTFDREFAQGGAFTRGPVARGLVIDARHQRRAFGANGFYGPSPSKEWTDQTLLRGRFTGTAAGWAADVQASYRLHHDRFRWDINRPGFAENTHRTDALELSASAQRQVGGSRLAFGTGSGRDWIDSSNLGDRVYSKAFAFAEAQAALPARTTVQAGVRVDRYSTFGPAWSPTLSSVTRAGDRVRLRGSLGRAFRVPTYTELYYRDPAHEASSGLRAERGWSLDGGIEWAKDGWSLAASPFARWDRDVIDWVRASPAERWRTTNTRRVNTRGVELAGARRWSQGLMRVAYTYLDVDPSRLDLLSKYVLEFAPHSLSASFAVPAGFGLRAAVTVDHRSRFDGQSYELVHLRLSRALRRLDLFVEASNLLDETYVEVPGVAMPGRWVAAGVRLRR